ncbi:MAG TPA: UvrD-helicase domain-containing protein, partial [Bacilli bacterium]|nr:UvrD-helicase domain-containing protein [Bacilli bacterium]
MTNWTSDQKDAIDTRGKKILVSAAAGSGKTAVLTERVIKYITDGNNIDRLLVVTFTNAAAQGLKSKIKSRLLELEKTNHINKQLVLLENAKITTMDAFYNDLVSKNFHKLNILPNFNIMDETSNKVLSNKIILDILENEFGNEDYLFLLDTLGVSNKTLIKDIIEKISYFFDTKPFYKDSILKILDDYKEKPFEESIWYKLLLNKISDDINMYINIYKSNIESLKSYNKVYEQTANELNKLNSLLKFNNIDLLFSNIRNFSFDRLQTNGCANEEAVVRYKAIREDLKNNIKKLNENVTQISSEEYINESKISYRVFNKLFEIVVKYKDKLLEEKIKLNSFTFSDISNFALELLIDNSKNKTDFAIEISNRYDEILIDEYQDTNELQNIIFNAISKNNNIFVVGDVKQSIYRFRKARPEIFINDKKEALSNNNIKLINLSKNFRCRKEIITFCNNLFKDIMSEEVGEINYDSNEELVYGSDYDDSGNNIEINIINKNKDQDIEDEEYDLTDSQKEAVIVANSIKKLLDSKYQIFDKEINSKRVIKPSDISILFRAKDNMDIFRRALIKRNINAYSESSELYFENYEVELIYAILQIIDNSYIDIPIVAVLSSPLFNFTFDELIDIRQINRYNSMYENLLLIGTDKSKDFINKLNEYKEYYKNSSISSLISYIYSDLNYINIIQSIGRKDEKRKNSIQMIMYAKEYEKCFNSNLSEFIKYIKNIIDNEIKVKGINPLPNKTCVKLLTIHSSKGLEYPVVYLVETGKQFNFIDLKQDFLIDDDYGMAFKIRDKNLNIKKDTLQYISIKELLKTKSISEELRILYVAITRAKERLIITGTCNNPATIYKNAILKSIDNKISISYMKNTKTYLEQIMPLLVKDINSKPLQDISDYIVKGYTDSNITLNIINLKDINDKEFEENIKEIENIVDVDIKVIDMNKIEKLKTVTSLKQKNTYIRQLESMSSNKAELGTLYHKVLEVLEVKKYNEDSLKTELNKLISNNILLEEDINKINIKNIYNFITSDIYNYLLESDYYKKEYEIFFEKDNMIIDGVIDLVFKYNN